MSTSFYVIIRPSILEAKKLKIPENFVKKFGYELGDVATLTVPNGYVWEVGLTKEGKNKIWFGDGWHEFVEYHSIGAGHFLVFKYGKDSKFQVLIFDKSATEIDYPCNEPQKLVNHDEMENENSVEIVDLTTPNPSCSSSENRVFDECPKKRSRNKMYTSQSSQNLEKDEFFVLLEHMGISISGAYRRSTQRQRQRALDVARLLNPKNPSFLVRVRESDVRRSFVYVPIKFARKYFMEVEDIIVLDSDENVLPMEHMWRLGTYLLTRWAGVCHDKNLVAGDICAFELINLTKKNAFLKVSVFHERMNLSN